MLPRVGERPQGGIGWPGGMLRVVLAFFGGFASFVSGVSFAAQSPNILIVYADDLGYGDVRVYNPDRGKIPTPHLDALSREGIRFTDAHSSSAVCSPSRYTLLTGRYHWRSRLQKGIVGLWGAPVIPSSRLTLGRIAQQAGYHTACVGKWHLGWEWPIPPELKPYFETGGYGGEKNRVASQAHRKAWRRVFRSKLEGGPLSVGFDEYFGVDVPNWPPYCFIEGERTVGVPTTFADPKLFEKNQANVQGPAMPGWTLEPILPALGRRAADIIDRSARGGRPFFLYLSLTSPHTPLSVNAPWRGASGLNRYADFVMETDAVVGEVLSALDDARITGETLVCFTSDNGCAPYIGVSELEARGHHASGPLRGYKADVWEGGHRVPFIVRWPGVIEPNSVCHQLVHQADLLATVAEILGRRLPPDAGEDSFSLLSLLKGERAAIRETAVSCSIRGVPSIRWDSWKWIPQGGSGGWSKGGDEDAEQLYNLAQDLGEVRNLALERPAQVKKLADRLERLIVNGRSTPGPRQANDVDVVRYPMSH